MSKKISELDAIAILAAEDILPLVDFGSSETKRMDVDSFFNFIPAGVNVGLGIASDTRYGIKQRFYTDSPPAGWPCGGQYVDTLVNCDTDNANIVYSVKGAAGIINGVPAGGYPTSYVIAVEGYAYNYGTDSQLLKLIGVNGECRQQGLDVDELYGGMFQASNSTYVSGNTTRITGIYADAYTTPEATGTFTVGTLYGAELRTFGKTNYATDNIAVTTAYGLYSSVYCQQEAGSTSTIGTAYNIYLTDLRPAGGIDYGTVTNYYGIYIVEPTKATNNWAIYAEGRFHFDQPTDDAAVPVLTLDQADLSEGLINFIADDRGVIAGATGSAVSVRVELDGTVYRLALYADA